MISKKTTSPAGIHVVLDDPRVWRTNREGQTWYLAVGVVQVLTESQHPEELWNDLKQREPALAALAESVEFISSEDARIITADGLDLRGVLRLVQSVHSPRAERIKQWLIESAQQRMAEADDPELALLRARRLYMRRGYSRRWIDKRLRGVSARHELTSEWHRHGAREGEDYRTLTNELMRSAFGMDVETYRQFKGLGGSSENLRDHMTDLELALTALAETTAVALHRQHNAEQTSQLLEDVHNAGQVVAGTIHDIEHHTGQPVVQPIHPSSVATQAAPVSVQPAQ